MSDRCFNADIFSYHLSECPGLFNEHKQTLENMFY